MAGDAILNTMQRAQNATAAPGLPPEESNMLAGPSQEVLDAEARGESVDIPENRYQVLQDAIDAEIADVKDTDARALKEKHAEILATMGDKTRSYYENMLSTKAASEKIKDPGTKALFVVLRKILFELRQRG